MDALLAIAMGTMGVAIGAIWTRDILAGEKVDRTRGLLRARDPDDGSLFWPHWLAEYGTAGLLMVGGVATLADTSWARVVSAFALGALTYTSINALGWAFAKRERYPYAAPMLVGAVVGIGGALYLFAA